MNFKSQKELKYMVQSTRDTGQNPLDVSLDNSITRYVEIVFKHFRKVGFPHFTLTTSEKNRVIEHLKKIKINTLWNSKMITKNNYGYDLCNSYHHHMQSVRSHMTEKKLCNSPMDTFLDDTKLKMAIRKCIVYDNKLHEKSLRSGLKFYGNCVKRVSNFRQTAAKAIYQTFLPNDGGKVYDPSMGYGGRILGAMSSEKVLHYTGTDPCQLTMTGLKQFTEDFSSFKDKTTLIQDGSENSDKYIKKNSIDLVFTSPPYFNCEVYSDEETQSWKQFSTKEMWMQGFMKKTMENCKSFIKKDGYIIINIANVKTYPNIEEDFVKMATKDVGLNLVDNLKLELANIAIVNSGGKNTEVKSEPIFVFQKKGHTHWAKKHFTKQVIDLSSFIN